MTSEKNEGMLTKNAILLLIIIVGVVIAIVVGMYVAKIKTGPKGSITSADATARIAKEYASPADIIDSLDTSSVPKNPAKAKEHFENGINYSLKKKYDKAIAEYLESIKYDSDKAETHSNLAFAYFDTNDYEKAMQEHKKAIAIDPKHANSYYGMALIYEGDNNRIEAIKNWEEFLKLSQPNSEWWNKAKDRINKLKGNK